MKTVLLLAALALTPTLLGADVLVLRGGDRITGKVELAGKRSFRLRTPYGLLTVPRAEVAMRVHADGREERLADGRAVVAPVAAPSPPPKRTALVIAIRGSAFWHAWDPRASAPDTRLRFQVSLDGRPVARYVDSKLDDDIPGALVNAFAFVAGEVDVEAGTDVLVAPPEARPGEARLRVELPPDVQSGAHELRVSYQLNESGAAQWQDVVSDVLAISLGPGLDTPIAVSQSRGKMEWSRKKMKSVDTFRVDAELQ